MQLISMNNGAGSEAVNIIHYAIPNDKSEIMTRSGSTGNGLGGL